MGFKEKLQKVGTNHFVLPKERAMKAPADLFLSEKLLFGASGSQDAGLEEPVFEQIITAASFPGVSRVVITPDCHQGYGVPIGSVVETDGILLPTAAGYDIGCGMVQLRTSLRAEDVADHDRVRQWISRVVSRIAIGVGASHAPHQRRLSEKIFGEVIRYGAKALGRTTEIAERACIPVEDDRIDIPDRAYEKREQLGSLGGGNHFLEMQQDEENHVWVMLHTGSRGFGWSIAKQFFVQGAANLGLPRRSEDRIWLDVDSKLGKAYWNLHNMAANFAIANRFLIAEAIATATDEVFKGKTEIYYEISHNLIQKEEGKFIARKGATRAFPGGHPALQGTVWEKTGHPILIPGSMESGSAILFAAPGASKSLYSINHGAGRRLSRSAARRRLDQAQTDHRMKEAGVLLNTKKTPIDESGPCYKNLVDVLDCIEGAGLAKVTKHLRPLACIKAAD